MPGAEKWTIPESAPSSCDAAPSVAAPTSKRRRTDSATECSRGGGAAAAATAVPSPWSDLSRSDTALRASALAAALGKGPHALHVATDGSVLDLNGAPHASGGAGIAWQWDDDPTTRGSAEVSLPWNHRGTCLLPPHTNISAEWYALRAACEMVLRKTRRVDGSTVRSHIALHVYIDCKAVLTWLQNRLNTRNRTRKEPTQLAVESNWASKAMVLGLMETTIVPSFASVTLHWVKAHRTAAARAAMTAQERLATELNERADAHAKHAAQAYTDMFAA